MKFGKYRIIPLSDVVFNNPPSSSFNFQKERDICDFIMTCNQHIDQVYNSSSLQQNESTPLSFITTLQTYLKDSPPFIMTNYKLCIICYNPFTIKTSDWKMKKFNISFVHIVTNFHVNPIFLLILHPVKIYSNLHLHI